MAAFRTAGFHPPDSAVHRCPEVGFAVEAVLPGRRLLSGPRIFPDQDLAGQEVWLRKAASRAAGPNRAPQIFPSQDLVAQGA